MDVLGFDTYNWHWQEPSILGNRLLNLLEIPLNKPVVLSEVGTWRTWYTTNWWTMLNEALQITDYRVSYALVWRNEYKPHRWHGPAMGSCGQAEFQKFARSEKIIMLPLPANYKGGLADSKHENSVLTIVISSHTHNDN